VTTSSKIAYCHTAAERLLRYVKIDTQSSIHPTSFEAKLEGATLSFIIRDFTESGLREKETLLREIAENVLREFPGSTFDLKVEQQYRNMKEVLDRHPAIVANALEAIARAGLAPKRGSIRGGTDGSRLSFMGLPCPNIFAGEHAFHSRLEWVSVQDMQKAVETIVHLAMIWEEKAA
jgi:tripeptide aminopeptidase